MSPAPSSYHQTISMGLSSEFFNFFKKRNSSCKVFAAPFDVTFTRSGESKKKAKTVLQPDICVICDLKKIDKRGCNGRPK